MQSKVVVVVVVVVVVAAVAVVVVIISILLITDICPEQLFNLKSLILISSTDPV